MYNEESKSICNIIGYGRSSYTDTSFKNMVKSNMINYDGLKLLELLELFKYHKGQYNSCDDFFNLKTKLINSNIEKNDIILFYFGIPSHIICDIIKNIKLNNIDKDYNCRYILEKPIGDSIDSCNNILNYLNKIIDSNKIYILDHYLGKSSIIELINKNITPKKIEILLYETELVDHRLQYFDNIGLFKDMIQSHVFTILLYCFPILFKSKPFNFKNIKIKSCIRGQYNDYKGNNKTETYIKLILLWNDIEIMIEVGKGISSNKKEIHYINNKMDKINIPITSIFSEYKKLLIDALNKDKTNYLTRSNILFFWELSDYIINIINNEYIFSYDIPMIL